MFQFTVIHVIENPKGHSEGYNYSLAGSVPTTLLDQRKATAADIMGGRSHNGMAWHGRKWESVQKILDAAESAGVKLCDMTGCACRKLF